MSKRYIDAENYKKDLIQLGFLPALVVSVLDKQPTADVVEVVRCKDCRWCEVTNWDGEILYGCDCCGGMNDIAPDYYCSYGERRQE